ncbi:hypothetical protein [Algivirga pacifica]|uniref:Peptidase M15A C-terminal domain-containing protein n=1 Tax=Algivirga pacifica TaxID=1162670 RepID=A0ABP9DHM9_9BACT
MIYCTNNIPVKTVDGLSLSEAYREVLKPDESVTLSSGFTYRLPRFFFEVNSYEEARATMLSKNFHLAEFLVTDFREAELLQTYPKYIPIAVTLTASVLELFRKKVGRIVRIASNGGYRSPAHAFNKDHLSVHSWGTAANIYKIGSEYLNDQESIEKYRAIIREHIPGAWVREYGTEPGTSYDQLHMDLGLTVMSPERIKLVD